MSKHLTDSFLPSGAVPSPKSFQVPSTTLRFQAPLTLSELTPPAGDSALGSPFSHSSLRPARSFLNSRGPISPPKSRSTSAEDQSAALVEDWRAYTNKLRSQIAGERTHMIADRARMEEVIAEERALWDSERTILKARIAQLEAELERRPAGRSVISPPLSQREQPGEHGHQGPLSVTSPGSNHTGSSNESSSSRPTIPQESGRNADGSPFYAPAPLNPSRTFELSDVTALRVDNIHQARDSPIRVTSKELTPSDFGVQSSPPTTGELKAIPEAPVESIDISLIQPELEGVYIRASALSPKFATKILSPQENSPLKLSPSNPPVRDGKENLNPQTRDRSPSPSGRPKPDVQGLMLQPETRRLTMHAGHTPNHSISKFADLLEDSGSATPTQGNTGYNPVHHPSTIDDNREEDEDVELSGPLGLTNEVAKDDAFIAQLVERLGEVKMKEEFSLDPESADRMSNSDDSIEDGHVDVDDDMPPLKLKPSLNFGRPIGRM